MKNFSIKYGKGVALIATTFSFEGKWIKKTLRVNDADSLWEGLIALSSIDTLPPEKQLEAITAISKAAERELLETAVPAWLLSGNTIKVLAPCKGKLLLADEEKASIINALGELGL